MSDQVSRFDDALATAEPVPTTIANVVARYGLVVVAGSGLLKFTSFEAEGIQPLTTHNNSALLRVLEVVTALFIAVEPWTPKP